MKNPALVVLYLIPALVFGFGAYLGLDATNEYKNFDATAARDELAAEDGNYLGVPDESEMKNLAWVKFQADRATAFGVMGGGLAGFTLPIAVTAIGRSTKNATRELAAELKRQ